MTTTHDTTTFSTRVELDGVHYSVSGTLILTLRDEVACDLVDVAVDDWVATPEPTPEHEDRIAEHLEERRWRLAD